MKTNLTFIFFIFFVIPIAAMQQPEKKETLSEAKTKVCLSWALFERQGIRPTMEDAYTQGIVQLDEQQEAHYFGLFDGHGGSNAADYAAEHAVCHFQEAYQEEVKKSPNNAILKTALHNSYLRLDKEIQGKFNHAGTTALTALIDKDKLILCWTGDSRAVVANKDGEIKARTIDHSPNKFEEKQRILKAGEKISTTQGAFGPVYRVGGLAMSRSLGDADVKATTKKGAIIPEPEFVQTTVEKGDVIILACDGLWDVMPNEQAVEFVHVQAKETAEKLKTIFSTDVIPAREKTLSCFSDEKLGLIALGLANKAYNKKSTDNISVLLIEVK